MLTRKSGTVGRALVFAAAVCTLLTGTESVARPATGQLKLEREGDLLYLSGRNGRLLIDDGGGWIPSTRGKGAVSLSGGYVVTPERSGDVTVTRKGTLAGKIVLRETLDRWLEDDAIWGGGKQANQLRYVHRSGGGLSGTITCLIAQGRSALAELTWRANGPSGQPVVAQFLIRIDVTPQPGIVPLRRLDVPRDWFGGLSWSPVPRLFALGKRLLLHVGLAPAWAHAGKPSSMSEVQQITPEGKTVRVVARIPPRFYPIGLLNNRWLVLGDVNEKPKRPFATYDLRSSKLAYLPGRWQNSGYMPNYVYVPDEGERIIVHQPYARVSWVVNVRSGKRIKLPNPAGSVRQYLWQGKAIIVGNDGISVYDAATGMLIQTLKPARGQS